MKLAASIRRWTKRAIVLGCLEGLWLAFAGSADYREIVAGLAGAIISLVGVSVYILQGKIDFRLHGVDIVQIWRVPWNALTGTWQILRSLALQLFVRNAPSYHGAVVYVAVQDEPFSRGRRALAVTYTTMIPNSVVLGIVPEQRLLLYHQILRGEVSKLTENLGAEP